MADRRPRSERPRSRAGKDRRVDLAVRERQHRSVDELRRELEPEVHVVRLEGVERLALVERIRVRATELAEQRGTSDVGLVVEATLDELFGLGPLEPVLRDRAVRVIRVEGAELYADDAPVAWGFRDAAQARATIERILGAVGQTFDASTPELTAQLVDGSVMRASLDGGTVRVRIVRP